MLLKPTNDIARPYCFEIPRILAANLAYLPTLQQSDVLVYNQTQVFQNLSQFMTFIYNFSQVWDAFRGDEKSFIRSVLRGFEHILFNLNDLTVSFSCNHIVTIFDNYIQKLQREKSKLQEKKFLDGRSIPEYHLMGPVQKTILNIPNVTRAENISVPIIDLSGALKSLLKGGFSADSLSEYLIPIGQFFLHFF